MLYLHETHRLRGTCEEQFERAYREGWMARLGLDDQARLLWYLHQTHGTGRSYQVVTITGVRDGAAWQTLADRVAAGDMRRWAHEVDTYRHDVESRLLLDVDFSPLEVELGEVSTDPGDRSPSLYMEDTMWPRRGMLDDYLRAAGSVYAGMLDAEDREIFLQIEAAFQTMPGAGRHPEVTLMQKVHDMDRLVWLLTNDIPEEMTRPGPWMHDALEYRNQWRSRLLRTATWSPLQ